MTILMKDSEIEWIGNIPKHWTICRFKDVINIYNGNSIKDEDKDKYVDSDEAKPYISSKDIEVIGNKINYNSGLYVKNDNISFKVAPKSSTLMCIEGGSAGRKKGFLEENVAFVNKLACFVSKSELLDNKFIYYFLNSPNYENYFFSKMTGLIGGVSINELKHMNIIIPSLDEQKQIVDYLDKKIYEIDFNINKNIDLIEMYKEYKQSLITEIVTKGLNPHVEMKDSGVDWIGEIPNEWIINKLKFLISKNAQYGANCEPEYDENKFDYRYIRITDIDDNGSLKDSLVYLSKDDAKNFILYDGDVLFARSGATVGKTYLYDKKDGDCCFAGYLIRYIPNIEKLNPKFLLYYSFSKSYSEWIKIVSTQSTIPNVSAEKYNELKMPLPSKQEQEEIINYLDEKCEYIDSIIDKKEKLIVKLEEYKKSLIYEYVTGKKEVPDEI